MKVSLLSMTLGLGVVVAAAFVAAPLVHAQNGDIVMPPISHARAQYFKSHPEAWAEFLSQLSQRPPAAPEAAAENVSPAFGGTWTAVTTAPVSGLCNPLLLTDGTIMVAECNTRYWYKLTPSDTGSYSSGTWTKLASLPVIDGVQYAPEYHASAVLPDGRVIIMGGEYNGSNTGVWTNLGAIYDPVANKWTAVAAPAPDGTPWATIGDAQSVVLTDGTFMLASCCVNPDSTALFDATTLTWSFTGAPNAGSDYQDEQGYNLLPNGDVLTVDIWTDFNFTTDTASGNPTNAERYVPATGVWESAGNTPVSLVDPYECGNFEIGPAVMRPSGTLVAFGGNSGCAAAPSKKDPTAIYKASADTWSAGPDVPSVCGTGKTPCSLADAPAAMLPNGNILFAASAKYGYFPPTKFFEYTSGNVINAVASPLDNASSSANYYYNFLVLPNGQILSTDLSNVAEVYTPTGAAKAAWEPVISSYPTTVTPGDSYPISGTQFSGLTQGAYYGDDVQTATNYPIVRITNTATGHVFYARTTNPSTMSIKPGAAGSTTFAVPATIDTGASELVVIANGIASKSVAVTVE
jgi:hypothetical protein